MLAVLTADTAAAILFADIAVIIVVARLGGALFKRMRQPAVVGEIVAGIVLGPTLLGAFPGNPSDWLFPHDVRPFLKVVAQLGLVIFMFIVGLELDAKLIRGKERLAGVISISSIALPFGLGLLLATVLYSSHQVVTTGGRTTEVEFLPFALFIGASMSITAFPVLARILTERGMYRTALGTITLAAAAVDDIVAWSLLALVLAVVKSSAGAGSGLGDLPRIVLESIAFVAVMFLVIRPRLTILADRYRRAGRLTPNILAAILVGVLFSAYATSKIGIHSIFGAFLFGVAMPREDTAAMFHEILERLEQVSVILLLPVFFVVAGLDTDVRALGSDALSELPLIVLAACAGKFIAAAAAARLQGIEARRASAIGVLMNTRGLTELVILEVGRSFGVLDDRLFTMLVVMAVITTIMTEPLLRLVYPDRLLERDVAEAEREALGIPDAYRVLVVVDDFERVKPLVDLSIALAKSETPSEIVLSRVTRAVGLELGGGLVAELAEAAASVDRFAHLTNYVTAAGISCVVRSHFSADPGADVVQQASAMEVDLILVGMDRDNLDASRERVHLDRLVDGAPCQVAALIDTWPGDPLPRDDVVVESDSNPGDAAAIEVAARLGVGMGRGLVIVRREGGRHTRRLQHWAERARAIGLGVEVTDARPQVDAGLLVVPLIDTDTASGGATNPILEVRAPKQVAGDELDRLLEKIGTRSSTSVEEGAI